MGGVPDVGAPPIFGFKEQVMKLAWATDIHLDCVSYREVHRFAEAVAESEAEACLITGDISNSQDLSLHLRSLQELLEIPVYFVLGNHDFYHSSIKEVRAAVRELTESHEGLHYVGSGDIFALTDNTLLSGVDGWSDGLAADFMSSTVSINDYRCIQDLTIPKFLLKDKLKDLGREEAEKAMRVFSEFHALPEKNMIFLTHPPPFKQAGWHRGQIQDDNWSPHFVCMQVGEAILRSSEQLDGKSLKVLCGHTHGSGVYEASSNVLVKTGGARYGSPGLAEVFEVE